MKTTQKRLERKLKVKSPVNQKSFKIPSLEWNQQNLFWLLAFLYVGVVIIWFLISPATWDEDCAVRFYNAKDAFDDPRHFISLWNRPLWILIFALPVQIGKISVPIVMSLISVLSAYFLFQSAKLLKISFAILVVPFLLMQPFFFGVAKDAMTEPLAACLVCAGLYALLKEKYLSFALIGSLLPLARTELVVFVALWACILLFRKQWKYIPLLGFGLLAWSTAAYLINGDFLYVFNNTIFKEAEANRYGTLNWWTYLRRYFYVLGPVIFFFFSLGFIRPIKKYSFFIYGQFFLGLLLYTLFTWKISIGHSAGFLRNLIPLSPLAAIIALYGFNVWLTALVKGQRRILFISLALFILTGIFFRNELWKHQSITDQMHFMILPIASILMLMTFLLYLLARRNNKWNIAKIGFVFIVIFSSSFSLIEEHPSKNMNTEREAILIGASIIHDLKLNERELSTNHTFLHWVLNENKNAKDNLPLRKEDLKNMKVGGVVVWDNHFGNRLGSDVSLEYLKNDPNSYAELFRVTDDRTSFSMVVFEKKNINTTATELRSKYIGYDSRIPELYLAQAMEHINKNEANNAFKMLDKVISMNERLTTSFAHYVKAQAYFNSQMWNEGMVHIDQAIDNRERFDMAVLNKAFAQIGSGKFKEGLETSQKIIEKNPNLALAHYYEGLAFQKLNLKLKSCKSFKRATSLGHSVPVEVLNQSCQL